MRNPIEVLKHLSEKSHEPMYKFQRLYRNLYNPEFYWLAYRNIYANKGSMTPGADGTTMDGISDRRIARIIASLQDGSYHPSPARRTYIAKKSNPAKKRPLGIPSGDDKLVQEVVRMLLESIYEPNFSDRSHGFRPRRSCHTALIQLQHTFTGANWFLEGDITACFDSFDHHVLIDLLKKRIDDEKFIGLMWKFLKAGYMDQWEYHITYSGTPQGSGMSPILCNVYLHELDQYMAEYQAKFAKLEGSHRKVNREYGRLNAQTQRFKARNAQIWSNLSISERKRLAKELKQKRVALSKTQSQCFRDETYRSLQYVRYADDFLVGIIGGKQDAEQLKQNLAVFLKEQLGLTLSDSKTKITHTTQKARFLGFDITITRSQALRKNAKGQLRRAFYGNVMLYVPKEKWANKLLELKAIRVKTDEKGKDHWRAAGRGDIFNRTDIEILSKYNAEVRGMYNYYRIADNVCVIGHFAGLMKHSMLRTFANKYRTKVRKIRERYERGGEFTVSYPTKGGIKTASFIKGFRRDKMPLKGQVDMLPTYKKYDRVNSLKARIRAKTCELCGKTDCELEFHQVKRLKDLRGKNDWERRMLDMRRKTLAVCHECHESIQSCDKS